MREIRWWHDRRETERLVPLARVVTLIRSAFPDAEWLSDDLGEVYLRWMDSVLRADGQDPAVLTRSQKRVFDAVGPLRGFRLNGPAAEVVLGVVRRDAVFLGTTHEFPARALSGVERLTSSLRWGPPKRSERPGLTFWPWFPPAHAADVATA